MKKWQFKGILTKNGWMAPAYLISDNGIINDIRQGILDKPDADLDGYLLPGFQNAHSHAFQYAMAGITENKHSSGIRDNFWSWRSAMYEIALKINPEQLRDIAAMVYSEMVKNGFTSVAEFHYLHHDKDGNSYNDPAELGHQMIEAAKSAGIRITLVPVFYQNGGFGRKAEKHQRRFTFNSTEEYFHLLECSEKHTHNHTHASMGKGVHSLRAADKDTLNEVLNHHLEMPFHMHISEQLREIEECKEYYGKRPVRWFLDNFKAGPRINLVHATHLSPTEIQRLGQSGANVVLCPTTEGNLGDGLFPLKEFQNNDGQWSIGTDSHIGINPMEELRLLDYGQRLVSHERNTFHKDKDSGLFAIRTAWFAGRKAMGIDADLDFFEKGKEMDGIVISNENPLISTASKDHLLSTFLYSSNPRNYKGTIVGGEWIYKDGQSKNEGPITRNFLEVLKKLKIR